MPDSRDLVRSSKKEANHMMKSRVARIGWLGALVVVAAAGILFLRALETGSSASAAPVAQDEENQQATEQPWLGAQLIAGADGLTVSYVIADGPADDAGLARGDVITAVDGTAVETPQDLHDVLTDKAVGDTLALSISRDGQAMDVNVTLEAKPEALAPAIPLLPELEGIAADELFGHFQGGQFNFTDANGNAVTAVIEAGTVASVDANAGTLTVNLNAGGSKTYTVGEDDLVGRGGGLSDLEVGDNVTVMTVNGDVRAVLAGGMLGFLPGFGGGLRHGGPGFGHGRMGFGDAGAAPESGASDSGFTPDAGL
jgi:membrane-associated protease RseP (regulator of RpoE activity)